MATRERQPASSVPAAPRLLMVGSVPCPTAEAVFRLVAPELGSQLMGLSDGEPGYRNMWIVFNGPHVYEPHPDIEVTNRPLPRPENSVFKDTPDWLPTSWEEMWRFRVRDGVDRIDFDNLHYAEFAIDSYAIFRRLRSEGVIPKDLRFQVSLPLPEDFTRWCTGTPRDFAIMSAAIERALQREIARLIEAIPPHELVLQWDVCWEVFACDSGDYLGRDPLAWKADGEPYERFAGYIRRLSPLVPETARLGMHLCYGDLEHSHLIEPRDLGVCVRMAQLAIDNAGRRFDYVHMPVPHSRTDDAYFAPLAGFRPRDTRLFIGLVHHRDGVAGALRRLATFRQHYQGSYGVATECGWGRRKAETIPELMRIHREVAAAL